MPRQHASGVRGPSREKRRDILRAACRLFLQQGFAATTLEEVAAEAGVSKQTVYAHFGDGGEPTKETLFRAMVEREVGRDHVAPHPLEHTMAQTDDLEGDLRTFARHHLQVVLRPDLVRLRRMLIGEAQRFPELARAWWLHGPERSFDLFAGWFTVLGERGLLDVPDPLLAARTFNWLVLSVPLNEAMALGQPRDAGQLDRHADEAVRVFLAAYGRR